MNGSRNPHRIGCRRARRGSVYLLVLMTTLIVGIIGLSAVALSRVELRRERQAQDAVVARAAARAAIEFGLLKIRLTTNWSDLSGGNAAWASNVSFNGGTYSLTRTAYDNTDPINDRLTLLAIGKRGDAVCQFQVVIVGGGWIEDKSWIQKMQ